MSSFTVIAPDLASHASVLADYLEALALSNYPSNVGYAELASIQRKQRPSRRQRDLVDGVEDEIGEDDKQETSTRVFAELEGRVHLLGSSYPFEISTFDKGARPYRPALSLKSTEKTLTGVQKVYICCLLISLLRDGLIEIDDAKLTTNARVGEIFQICSCVAAGGYYKGSISSFGFPRATKDAFLPALKSVFARFGHFSVVEALPIGHPASLKDAGVDIIGWRHFSDSEPSCDFVFGQVASGHNWEEKPVAFQAQMLIGNWLAGPGTLSEYSSAIFIPFPVDHRSAEESPPTKRRSLALLYNWPGYGTIFDRFRITSESLWIDNPSTGQAEEVDGFDRVNEVFAWVSNVLGSSGNPN